MSLWQRLLAHEGVAVYADEQTVSYAELRSQSRRVSSPARPAVQVEASFT